MRVSHFDYLRGRVVHLYSEYHISHDETLWPVITNTVRALNRIIIAKIDNEKVDTKIYVFGLPADDRPRMMRVYLTFIPEIEKFVLEELMKPKRNINKI